MKNMLNYVEQKLNLYLINIEVKNYKRFITKNTKLLIINNPNNPRGKVYTEEELREIYEIAINKNIFILIDEAYSDFVIQNFKSMANIAPDKKGIIIINSLSKNLGISGWRIGFIISSPEINKQILKLNQHIITCAPTILSMYVDKYYEKIYKNTSKQIISLLKKRIIIQKYLKKINLKFLSGDSTFYFFISIERFIGTDLDFSNYLLYNHKISVVPGSAYGVSTNRYIRVSFGTETVNSIKSALDKIKTVINIKKINRVELEKKIKIWTF